MNRIYRMAFCPSPSILSKKDGGVVGSRQRRLPLLRLRLPRCENTWVGKFFRIRAQNRLWPPAGAMCDTHILARHTPGTGSHGMKFVSHPIAPGL
jgi:hypothetical protein